VDTGDPYNSPVDIGRRAHDIQNIKTTCINGGTCNHASFTPLAKGRFLLSSYIWTLYYRCTIVHVQQSVLHELWATLSH